MQNDEQATLKNLGAYLVTLRKGSDKSQKIAASHTKTTRMQMWRYENGKCLIPIERLRALLTLYKTRKRERDKALHLYNVCARLRLIVPFEKISWDAVYALGSKIKQLRLESELKQYELSTKVGISQSLLCQIENGNVRPKEYIMDKIVDALAYAPEHNIELLEAWRRCVLFDEESKRSAYQL